jgi:hypothetical protein
MNHRELAHKWAHDPTLRRKSSTMWTDGEGGIYHYQTCIARHAFGGVTYNTHGFSTSTSKVQGYILRAIPTGTEIFRVEIGHRGGNLRLSAPEVLAQYIARADARWADANTTKRVQHVTRAGYVESAINRLREAERVAIILGLACPRPAWADEAESRLPAARDLIARADSIRREREAARLAQGYALEAERVPRWLAGEPIAAPRSVCLFRVRPGHPDEVESTLGVRVPREDIARAVRLALRVKAAGTMESPDGLTVGGYKVNRISPAGVIAGCHHVSWSEVERLAGVL